MKEESHVHVTLRQFSPGSRLTSSQNARPAHGRPHGGGPSRTSRCGSAVGLPFLPLGTGWSHYLTARDRRFLAPDHRWELRAWEEESRPGASQEADRVGNEPSQVTGHLDPGLSRWLWLVKWILVIPHYIILALLWIAFLVVTVAAGFAILFTGRYPASLFQFTVGVLRWNWRVDVLRLRRSWHRPLPALYPRPQRLSGRTGRCLPGEALPLEGTVQVLAVRPAAAAHRRRPHRKPASSSTAGISLLSLLVCIAAVILLFTGVYRLGIFDLLMGINRWTVRTISYAALMSDKYPPFRLDQGPLDPPSNPWPSAHDCMMLTAQHAAPVSNHSKRTLGVPELTQPGGAVRAHPPEGENMTAETIPAIPPHNGPTGPAGPDGSYPPP